MFWNKKPQLTVTPEDKRWIEEALITIRNDFGDYFYDVATVVPTDYNGYEFTGLKADAEFVLETTKAYFALPHLKVKLSYFSDEPVYMADGTILSSPADETGKWNSAAGTYEHTDEGVIISVETSVLKNPQALVATIAHELAHFILLEEFQIDENDEYLTDLVAIACGFGLFLGNTHFQHAAFRTHNGAEWQTQRTGYLPEPVIAYAMAWLCTTRKEETGWKHMLNPTMLKLFDQSIEYIRQNPDKINFG